jgi:hypothetical protein
MEVYFSDLISVPEREALREIIARGNRAAVSRHIFQYHSRTLKLMIAEVVNGLTIEAE